MKLNDILETLSDDSTVKIDLDNKEIFFGRLDDLVYWDIKEYLRNHVVFMFPAMLANDTPILEIKII